LNSPIINCKIRIIKTKGREKDWIKGCGAGIVMGRYVAFFRGINVGGNTMINRERLKEIFELLGMKNVRVLLNSGNVIFETSEDNTAAISLKIREGLRREMGFEREVIIRSGNQIKSLVDFNPFKDISVTPNTRLYVTFIEREPSSSIKIPYFSAEGDLQILQLRDGAACIVLVLSPGRGTVDMMARMEKEWGKHVTTRNWNSILKIAKILES
jgi:uncharacterized protein (DUF1697 family)